MTGREGPSGRVMAGRSERFAERLLGTVSSALPAHAKCPTVVVPLRARGAKEPADAPIPAVEPIRRVMVGVDGSPQSELALRCALREARRWQATVVVVSAVPVNTVTGVLAWLPEPVDHRAVLADVEESLALVSQMLRPLADARVEAIRVGVRPMPKDEKPMLGTVPGLDGFYVAVSHSGVTLGPLWGRIVTAELLDGQQDARLETFRPARFLPS